MRENYIATIVHNRLEEPIVICSDTPVVMTIENPREFFLFVRELIASFKEKNGFILLRDEVEQDFEKACEVISDVFSLDFGERKAIVSLHKELARLAQDGELILLKNEINTRIAEFYASLFDRSSLNLSFDEIELPDLLKISNVRMQNEYDTIAEKIVCYINACVQLKHKTIFVFVNLKSVLSDSELELIYKHCALEKVGLLLLEGRSERLRISGERRMLITDDLCEIVDDSE